MTTAVPTSFATTSATASTTHISSAVFAAAIVIVPVCCVETEQHGYVLLLLCLLVNVKSGSTAAVRYVLAGVGVCLLSLAMKRAAKSSAYCVSLSERPPPSRRLVIRKLLACPCTKLILLPRGATDLIASARRQG